ncbi:hypothetical protein FQN49_003458 [Arthroderma sp. PD_2]|nr:hypothetical protein FQN49_003458 [Arthroderma sp. PD_2]
MEMEFNPVAAWDQLAESWDATMGTEGNDYYIVIELPALERMVQPKSGDRALDLATGNGLVAHWLGQRVTSVLATDASPAMIVRAQAQQALRFKDRHTATAVTYKVLDVTSPQHFEELISSDVGVRFSNSYFLHFSSAPTYRLMAEIKARLSSLTDSLGTF